MRAAQIAELGSPPEPVDREGEGPVEILAVALNPLDLAIAAGRFYGGHPPLPYVPGCEAVGRLDGKRVYLFGEGRGIAARRLPGRARRVPGAAGRSRPGRCRGCGRRRVRDRRNRRLAAPRRAGAGSPRRSRARSRGDGNRGLDCCSRSPAAGGRTDRRRGSRPRPARARAASSAPTRPCRSTETASPNGCARHAGGDGPTLVVDALWGEPVRAAAEAAAPGARIVHVGQSAGPEATLPSAAVRGKRLSILGHSNFALSADERRQAYLEVVEHVAAGRIRIDVETFSLDEVADAWAAQGKGAKAVVCL